MTYFAYLLRIWVSEHEGQRRWRASLENAHGPERRVFDNFQELLAFLEEQIEEWDRQHAETQGASKNSGAQK